MLMPVRHVMPDLSYSNLVRVCGRGARWPAVVRDAVENGNCFLLFLTFSSGENSLKHEHLTAHMDPTRGFALML
jgi:hypothetical protein